MSHEGAGADESDEATTDLVAGGRAPKTSTACRLTSVAETLTPSRESRLGSLEVAAVELVVAAAVAC